MAAHQHWRLQLRPFSASYVALAGLEFHTSIGGSAIAVGTVTKSGEINPTFYPVTKLFDNDNTTAWLAQSATGGDSRTGNPFWVAVDFGTPVDVVELKLIASGSSVGELSSAADLGTLDHSEDGQLWTACGAFVIDRSGYNAVTTVSGFADAGSRVLQKEVRLDTAWPAGPLQARMQPLFMYQDIVDGGAKHIVGTVVIDDSPDIPVSRRVRLYHKQSGRLVGETFSKADGSFAFENLKDQAYFVIAHDNGVIESVDYNAVVADAITPEAV